ncbi:uncharacterized protein BXZ73DRAFT_89153 [Epithele typhae]|uniref:uncharacterized protein n=1 Tax=Epithele typhae TaxID=378194 RepID=UPI0020079B36|nr:uncharacterized protein BXZ73DRAFT_89153 [Epithele typhae]KAH9939102.1 hypothetical protein BXZ73DRAFT_89153 [Epithele typhae]
MATDISAAPEPPAPNVHGEPTIQWDGDRMFNIYIYDYCVKRGFRRTAHELMSEASIPPTSQPPINAKQGLLFEWWSVFWVLFTAKSSGQGPDDALLYTQHQTALQNASAKPQNRPPPPPGQPQQGRYYAPPNTGRPPLANGPQPNGIAPPPPQAGGSLPNGAQNPDAFHGGVPQPNGVPGSSAGPPGSLPPGQNMQPVHPNHRPPQQQPRQTNGAPYPSPTMANSPAHPPGGPHPTPVGNMGGVGNNQPLTQMAPRMHPPNGPPGHMGGPQQNAQPGFSTLGRSPSNPASPAGNALTGQSPSMMHRVPPGQPMQANPMMLEGELRRIPPQVLTAIKIEAGLGEKDFSTMSVEEKVRVPSSLRLPFADLRRQQNLLQLYRRKSGQQPPPGAMQPPPSGLRNNHLPPGAQQPGQPPMGLQQGSNALPQRSAKRSSTSPGQELQQPEQLPKSDSSPPDRKRPRRSPAGGESSQPPYMPQQGIAGPSGPMQPPMAPGQQPGGMLRQPMNIHPPPMASLTGPMMNQHMGGPQMMQPMNAGPGMMQQGPPGAPPGAMQHYRQSMLNAHKPQHLQNMPPGGAPSPSAGGQDVGPPGSRPPPHGKPMGMMPPPSPAMAAKAPGMQPKVEDGSGQVGASPRQNGMGGPGPGPSGPPAGHASTPTPAPPTPNASGMAAPSPSGMMSTPTMASHQPPPPPPSAAGPGPGGPPDQLDPTFSLDFTTMPDFDPSITLFGTGESINFERDFAAWFDPENVQ